MATNGMEQKPDDAARADPGRCRSRAAADLLQREVKARFDAALAPRDRLRRAAGVVLVEPFLRLGRRRRRAWPAATSARRSARMCSAASPTCCSPSSGHPAMLFYLDNSRSIGPKSVAGLVNTRGLNENLAREILELHTLGVRSVYTQDDVTQLRQGADRLDHSSGGDRSGARRRVRVQSAHARAGSADRRRQGLCAAGRRAGPGGARRYRAPPGDRRACGAQARAPFLLRRAAGCADASGSRSASSTPTAT